MSKNQKVVFYLHHLGLSGSVDDLIARIKHIEGLKISDRNWNHDGDVFRLDSSKWHRVESGPAGNGGNLLWLCNIACLRDDRPALGSLDAPVEDLVLSPGQDATEETAVLFDFSNSVALVQYNHRGARASGVAEYINMIKGDPVLGLTLNNLIDGKWFNSKQARQACHSIDVGVCPSDLSSDFDSGNVSLNQAIKGMGSDVEKGFVKFRFTPESRPGDGFLSNLMRALNGNSKAFLSAKVGMRNLETNKMDVFDLFAKRERIEVKLRQNSAKRLTPEARWTAMLSARGNFPGYFTK